MARKIGSWLGRIPLAVGLLAFVLASQSRAAGPFVYVLPTTGVVDSVMATYLSDGIARAARDGAAAVVIELNTPGGNLQATTEIVSALLKAPVPTIVWVSPPGGRAASAGTFITLAAHIALMAPATNIGAASPVGSGGEDIGGTLGEKVKNDAIANITAIAQERGRNVEWAVSTVASARSSSANEAVQLKAVDGIAGSLDDVLAFANGKTVKVGSAQVTLDLKGATTTELDMNPFQAFLHLLSDPNIAFLLFTLGFYGLLFEIYHPNFVTGTIGGLSIVLAFVGFGSLPLNVAGLLLIGLAVALFTLEPHVTSHGILTVAAIVCLVLGASALYTEPASPEAPVVSVALPLLITMVGLLGVSMMFITLTAIRTRRMVPEPRLVGSRSLPPGQEGEVRRPLAPVGSVFVAGEEWSAKTPDESPLQRGAQVRVIGQDGLVLVVEPLGPATPAQVASQ